MGKKIKTASEVQAHKNEAAALYQRMLSQAGRDIGDLPEIKNKRRKKKCEKSLLDFCKSYFPHLFSINFSLDHIKLIEAMQSIITAGGMQAIAMPRGSGKTTICEVACLWCLLYGKRPFVFLIGSTETAAKASMQNLKTELESNDNLLEDFPEVCYPIRKMEGISKRAGGQLYHGERTRMSWTENEINLPVIKGSQASGGVVRVAGITGRLRGAKITTPDGKSIRPSIVLLDDIQTSESAASSMQCKKRLEIIMGDVLGLAGAKQKISAIMPITVIQQGDVADTLLDLQAHPEWHGLRVSMLKQMPEKMDLWDKYSDIYRESMRINGDARDANAFYLANKKSMDAGAVVYWEERYNADELSALQNAMNLYYQDKRSFYAEYQNTPLKEELSTDKQISKQDLIEHLNGLKKSEVMQGFTTITAGVDVQKDVLFYTVLATDNNFSTQILEYGSYPEQGISIYDLQTLRHTLQQKYKGQSLQTYLQNGLTDLINALCTKVYYDNAGGEYRISKILIDSAWQESTDAIYKVCQQSPFASIVMPSRGLGITASKKPMSQYRKKAGETLLHGCLIKRENGRAIRMAQIDVNLWKSYLLSKMQIDKSETGGFSIYGDKNTLHDLFFTSLLSEYHTVLTGEYGSVREWHLKPTENFNHWLDCIVYGMTAAHLCGVTLEEWQTTRIVKRVSLKQVQNFETPTAQTSETPTQQTEKKPLSLKKLQQSKH